MLITSNSNNYEIITRIVLPNFPNYFQTLVLIFCFNMELYLYESTF